MYLNYYNLSLKPFEISPDPKFLWLGEKHKEAFSGLKYCILENKGFMSLTGDVGTGKTTIVNALANSLGDNFIFAQISDPSLEALDFFNLTADGLEMNKQFSTKGDFLGHLSRFLNNAYVNNKDVVLIIEEAQRLDQELLEQIRLLSNIERPDKKLITIIFVGQLEFNNILKKNKALRQRITIIYNIEPLTDFETEKYIIHRLKVAGSEEMIFSQGAIREIFSFSEGNPRLINIICDLALLTGYVQELKIIEPEIIKECAANFQLPDQTGQDLIEEHKALANTIEENMAKKRRTKPARRKIAYMAPVAAIILACVFGYFYYFGNYNAFSLKAKTFLEKAIGRFTSSKSETSFQKADEMDKRAKEIAALEELKSAKERVAELESAAVGREQMLSQSEQKLAKLAQDLDQEKESKGVIQAELSSKDALVAELQEQLETLQSKALKSEGTIENNAAKIAELQEQLMNLKTQESSTKTQLDQLRSRNNELVTELKALQGAKERVTELENAVAQREQLLSESEQKLTELAKYLAQEKKSKDVIQAELSSKVALAAELENTVAQREQLLSQSGQKLAKLAQDLDQEKESKGVIQAELSTKAALVAELQKKLEVSDSYDERLEVENSKKEIAQLKDRLADFAAQKASAETQLGQLKTRYEDLQTVLKELKITNQKVAELEKAMAQREQLLSQSEQKLAKLAQDLEQEKVNKDMIQAELSSKVAVASELESAVAQREQLLSQSGQKLAKLAQDLDQEKESKDVIQAELSSKAALVAELQEQIETLQLEAFNSEGTIENNAAKIAELQEQLTNLKTQASSAETQLGQLRSRNNELVAELEALQSSKERITELESAMAQREQLLSESEQKLTELAKNLAQEKKSKDVIQAELSSKVALAAELQEKLAASETNVIKFEDEFRKSQTKIAELQGQLANLEAQKTPPEPTPLIVETPEKLTPIRDISEIESPSPADIIDWVIKKKSE
jgi:type II secretory pathway predicted ATPase ExeA/chromosome segregation ATPase